MGAHFWMDAHGRSWTLMDDFRKLVGRWEDASRTILEDLGRSENLVKRRSRDDHGTVTVTLQIHKKYCTLKKNFILEIPFK
jgi:hypothetical protein